MQQANRNKIRGVSPTGWQTTKRDELLKWEWGHTFLVIGIFMFPFDLFAELRGGLAKETRTNHSALLFNFYVDRMIPLKGTAPWDNVDLVFVLWLAISCSLTTIVHGILHCLDLFLWVCWKIIFAVKKIRAKKNRFTKFEIKDEDKKFVNTQFHGKKKVALVEKKKQ